MPRRYSMASLMLSCQQQVALEHHDVIESPEWFSLISRAYGELYAIVFESGLQYFEYSTRLTTDGTNVLAESSDMMSTVSLSFLVASSPDKFRDLRPLQPQERSAMSGQTGTARYFEMVDDEILLYPTPPIGQVYEMRYVPQPPDLTTYVDLDIVDVVTPDGLEFLIWSVAVKALIKTEADPRAAIAEREASRVRFTESARDRALLSSPKRIVDFGDDGTCDW